MCNILTSRHIRNNLQPLCHLFFIFTLLWTNTFLHDSVEVALGAVEHHFAGMNHDKVFHHHHGDDSATAESLTVEDHVHAPLAVSHHNELQLQDTDLNDNGLIHGEFVCLGLYRQVIGEQAWQRPPPAHSKKYGLPIYLLHRRLLI